MNNILSCLGLFGKILHWSNNIQGFAQKSKRWYLGKKFSEWFWFHYEFSCASKNNFNILRNWQGRALDGRTLSATWSSKHNQYPVVRTRPQYIWCRIWSWENGVLLPKLFWPTVRKNCSIDWEKKFEIRGWRPRIFKNFGITRTIYSNSEMTEQFLVTECFLNFFPGGFSDLID